MTYLIIRIVILFWAFLYSSSAGRATGMIEGTWELYLPKLSSQTAKVVIRADLDATHGIFDTIRVPILSFRPTVNASQMPHEQSFKLAREAGTFVFTGRLTGNRGKGTFVFEPNLSFTNDLRSAGYAPTKFEQLTAADLDVTTDYARSIGIGSASLRFSDVLGLKALGIEPQYVNAMHLALPGVSYSTIMAFHTLQIAPQYVESIRSTSIRDLTAKNIASLAALKVDPAFVRDLSAVGYSNLSTESIIRLHTAGIDTKYIKKLAAQSHSHLTIQQLLDSRGVNP